MSSVRIETFHGQREALRDLFELAADSPSELAYYLDLGRVLVARTGSGEIVGHLQLFDTGEPGTLIDGIELLDRVWLDQNLHPGSTP